MALKPAVEFDVVSKSSIGLSVTVNMNFIKANNPPDPNMLSDLIIIEAIVGNITTLNNKLYLRLPVVYSIKSAERREKLFTHHIKILQMCETCLNLPKFDDVIINDSSLRSWYCKPCLTSNGICDKCKEILVFILPFVFLQNVSH